MFPRLPWLLLEALGVEIPFKKTYDSLGQDMWSMDMLITANERCEKEHESLLVRVNMQ